jgi:hypothetical protein
MSARGPGRPPNKDKLGVRDKNQPVLSFAYAKPRALGRQVHVSLSSGAAGQQATITITGNNNNVTISSVAEGTESHSTC